MNWIWRLQVKSESGTMHHFPHHWPFKTPPAPQLPVFIKIKRDPWVLGILGRQVFLAFIELSSNHTVLCTSLFWLQTYRCCVYFTGRETSIMRLSYWNAIPEKLKSKKLSHLQQWFSTRGSFFPQGTFGNVWRHFWLSWLWWGLGNYRHLEGRGQGRGWTCFIAQDSPQQRSTGLGHANGVEDENPWSSGISSTSFFGF